MTFKRRVSNVRLRRECQKDEQMTQKQEPDNDPIFFFFFLRGRMMNENRQQQLLNREIGND